MYNFQIREWPKHKELVPHRSRRHIKVLLLDSDRVLAPSLHIGLGLMMRFTYFLDKSRNCSPYLHKALPGLTAIR